MTGRKSHIERVFQLAGETRKAHGTSLALFAESATRGITRHSAYWHASANKPSMDGQKLGRDGGK